jgi:carbonic anhydrase
LKKLIAGILEFHKNIRPNYRETFARLALGQAPDALLVACSDSRVAPNLFASTQPGDMFVIRNPGNLIAPCGRKAHPTNGTSEAAAIEFTLTRLSVTDMVICGHSECGAMRALLDQDKETPPPHIRSWLTHGQGALRRLRDGARMNADLELHNHLSQLNVLEQLDHLRTYPAVRVRLKERRLRLHAWWFDIREAEVLAYDEHAGRFMTMTEDYAEWILDRAERGQA